jgi:hypothetical protein
MKHRQCTAEEKRHSLASTAAYGVKNGSLKMIAEKLAPPRRHGQQR